MSANTNLNMRLGTGGNDLVALTDGASDLTLDGLLNVTANGTLNNGTYNLISYYGNLTDNGLTVNSMPAGKTGTIGTSGSSPKYITLTVSGTTTATNVPQAIITYC